MASITFSLPSFRARRARNWEIHSLPNTVSVSEPVVPARPRTRSSALVARKMDRAHGVALETLAHAIEYLTLTTLINHDGVIEASISDVQAIAMLKESSRNLYASLPVKRSMFERILARAPRSSAVVFPLG